MILRENVRTHLVEALLIAALLNSEVQLHYLSRNVNGDIEEGTSIVIRPEWGKSLLDTVIKSLRNKEVGVKTISCSVCPLRSICPFSNLGDKVVIPDDAAKIIEELERSLFGQGTGQAPPQ